MKKDNKRDKRTSITCKQSTIEELRKVEVHPRETHEEIILRLILQSLKNGGLRK